MNDSFDHIEGLTQLCKEQDTFGFDLNAGQTWVYPTNLPIRDYQFNITEKALYENTLVCLPTGLGKTFIAAVVMYNFYRWYPMGKIIFMAPTKPLVAQQLDACYNIMAIPNNVTAEITGTKDFVSRENTWKEKRVFFITPQILQNDIETVLELAPQIRCIVVDEAHKALGKHANCEAIKKIYNLNRNFRVLALSATPGSNFTAVRDVITNLLISHIEVRTNESNDVARYIFQRRLDTIVIPITGKLLEAKNEYIKILDTYTRPLIQYNIISGNCANITKGRIVLIMKEFKEKSRQHSNYSSILRNLNICITLYHGYELLVRHGLRGFLTFFEGNISKPLIRAMQDLHAILENIRQYLGPAPAIDMLPDGTIPEITGDLVFSHPKFDRLSEVLLEHFARVQDADTRVMVFCEYRESVMETYTILLRHRPAIKPRIFLGQGAISQAQQIQTVRMFKSGACNTLVSTCIGEEGLDVGEVDLIVCFDISTKSPIRMVQRMGRTGRKRDGRVVVLVTEGKEQQLLHDCLAQKNSMISLLESQPIRKFLYDSNPRMIPTSCQPECHKMFITVQQRQPAKKMGRKTEKRNTTVKSMFANITSSQASSSTTTTTSSTTTTNSELSEDPKELMDFSTKWTRSPTKGKTTSPVKRGGAGKKTGKKLDISKQHDLRSMFTKLNNTQSTVTSTSTSSTEHSSAASYEPETQPQDPKLTALLENIQSYLTLDINNNNNNACILCDQLFQCNRHTCAPDSSGSEEWTVPDESIFDKITSESLAQYMQSLGTDTSIGIREDNLETSLDYFNLDSITDIFSDDSTENVQSTGNTVVQNPNMFTQPFGEFNTPRPHGTPMKDVEQEEDDDVVESDTEQSPTLRSFDQVLSLKAKIQRKLLAQHSSTPNVNFTANNTHLNAEINSATPKNKAQMTFNVKQVNSNLEKCDSLTGEASGEKNTNCFNNSTQNSQYHISITPKLNTKQLIPSVSCNRTGNRSVQQNGGVLTQELPSSCTDTPMDISPIRKRLSNENFQIWDESIFETSDVEDDFKLRVTPEKRKSCDSDETVILTFDENDFERAKNTSHVFETNSNNASLCNKTDKSLLSVTQMIDCLNDSKNNSKSCETAFKITDNSVEKSQINAAQVVAKQAVDLRSSMATGNVEKSPLAIGRMNHNLSPVISKKYNTHIQNSPKNTSNSLWISPNRTQRPASTQNRTQRLCTTPSTRSNNPTLGNSPIFIDTTQTIGTKHNASQLNKGISNKLMQNIKPSAQLRTNKPEVSHTVEVSDENSPNNSQEMSNGISRTNSGSSTQENHVVSDDLDIQAILKDMHFSDSSDEEPSLLSFSQNAVNNRRKKFKLQLTQRTTVKESNITLSQNSPVRLPKKKVLNTKKTLEISDSDDDDDFEIKPSWMKTPKKIVQRTQSVSSSSKMDAKQTSEKIKSRSQSDSRSTAVRNVKRRKHPVCEFIDDEAEVKNDEHFVPDSQQSQDSEELLNSSFINDTQSICDQSDMQAKYLQSVRSPKFGYGAFKMPAKPKMYEDVFSQEIDDQNDTYMNDSFCVGNDETLSQRNQMSYLEMAEAELERQRKTKKRKRIIRTSDSD